MLFHFKSNAQISGKVFSLPDSIPLSGALIKLQNGQRTLTDAMGRFTLTLSNGKNTLMVSHLAYMQQTISVQLPTKQANIYLMPKQNRLEDVTVSTGYYQIPKERSTGSFTTITTDQLNEQAGSDLISRLDGLASGFSTDRKTNNSGIMIRGLSSISGPRNPLIVLDNFPYEGDLNNLNPNDVENITILKDAAAASIWGARAGNGVIVITTKKGRFNAPLKIQGNTMFQFTETPNPDKLRNMSVGDFISTERFLFEKGYYAPLETSTTKAPITPVVELLIAGRDGKISQAQMETSIAAIANHSLEDEYRNLVYRPTLNQQYSLNLSSGSENINWNLSAGYDQNRNVLESKYKRVNLKSAQNFTLSNKLLLSTQVIYTRSERISGKTDINELTAINGKLPPYTLLADENGNALSVMKSYRLSYINSTATAGLLDWNYYPLTDDGFNRSQTHISDLVGNASLKYTIIKGLNTTIYYQYEQQRNEGSTLQQQDGYANRSLINGFTQITGTTIKRPVPLGDILIGSTSTLNLHQFRLQSSFDKTMGRHNLNVLAGAEVRASNVYGTGNRSYGYDAVLLKAANVDYANTYSNFVTGSNSYIPNVQSFAETINNYISFYANGAYTYKNRYILSASARNDASNLFGLNTNDKWNPLWSAGLAWKISDEPFYHFDAVSSLKVRGSYGLSGNIDPNKSALTTIGYINVSPYTQTSPANFSAYANPELRWEKSAMLNLAVDFVSLNNRLSGSIEYFHKKGTDLYGKQEVDYTAGIGSYILKNAASMTGRGWDVNLNSENLNGKLKWRSDFFLNIYEDKITDYYLTSQQGSAFISGDVSISGIKGYPVYSMLSYKWAGLNPVNGNPRGYLNGMLSEDYAKLIGPETRVEDLVYSGSSMPKYTLALGNTFEYGPFSLTFRLSGKFGYFYRRESLSYNELFARRQGNADFADRWQNPGDELRTNVPSMVYPFVSNRDNFYQGSEATVAKGDHTRLQYLNLKYNLKLKGSTASNLEIYFYANNLGILWQADHYGIDPDYLQYPPSKTYAIGLRANF